MASVRNVAFFLCPFDISINADHLVMNGALDSSIQPTFSHHMIKPLNVEHTQRAQLLFQLVDFTIENRINYDQLAYGWTIWHARCSHRTNDCDCGFAAKMICRVAHGRWDDTTWNSKRRLTVVFSIQCSRISWWIFIIARSAYVPDSQCPATPCTFAARFVANTPGPSSRIAAPAKQSHPSPKQRISSWTLGPWSANEYNPHSWPPNIWRNGEIRKWKWLIID